MNLSPKGQLSIPTFFAFISLSTSMKCNQKQIFQKYTNQTTVSTNVNGIFPIPDSCVYFTEILQKSNTAVVL